MPARIAAGEAGDLDQLHMAGWRGPGRFDDGGVRQHPSRGQVDFLRDPVPEQPQLAEHREPAPRLDPVDARGAAPWIGPRGRRISGEYRRELLLSPFGLALLGQLGG